MTRHPNLAVIARYAGGGDGLDEATVWSVEAHLENCADCRARLAGSVGDQTRALLDRIASGLDVGIAAGPPPAHAARPWSAMRRRWFVWALVPWLAMTVAVLGCAYLLDRLRPDLPSLVLLLAPVAPLPGVAVAWSRRADPAWELVAGTPGAGLAMLLRRAVVVLAVVVPALALLGIGSGISMALMLLPSLAGTAATIALGGVLGLHRAATGIGAAWGVAVVVPSMATMNLPVVLSPGSIPIWALITAALVAVTATRADGYRWLSSRD
ncbi:zf-HC2 domain-containing protein [Micromonospora sp. WMMA1363]|uniref:zf-HC2 domain-containing protein n=1 Tax=Micromonospora sp. WMMA1363 TaxID=3053985 RepID=UPI00259CC532|nr:zf-HC2 domain-containing protein [Micromonospora sp. WMMA1363]MDM4720229.1 zf-HC2 domain-containing protein [Micromonospora sp. WMMA1363]